MEHQNNGDLYFVSVSPKNSGWRLMAVKTVNSTLWWRKSSNVTSCRSLLESVTLFTSRTWFTTTDPLGPHCLLSVTLGEMQRVGTIPAGSALSLDGVCILVVAALNSLDVWSVLWDLTWSSSWTFKAESRTVGVDEFDSALILWFCNVM